MPLSCYLNLTAQTRPLFHTSHWLENIYHKKPLQTAPMKLSWPHSTPSTGTCRIWCCKQSLSYSRLTLCITTEHKSHDLNPFFIQTYQHSNIFYYLTSPRFSSIAHLHYGLQYYAPRTVSNNYYGSLHGGILT